MTQENPEPPAIAASAGPPCWAELHEHLRRSLHDLGCAWQDRESKPIHADVSLLSVMRRLRGILDCCGVERRLTIEAGDALKVADELYESLRGTQWSK